MKHCYIRFHEDFHVLFDNRYIEVFLLKDDEGEPICALGGCDDWELSYSGPDAEDKFNALLYVSGEVSWEYIIQLGFKQYG